MISIDTLEDILQVLNAPCGDILKAQVLNAAAGFKINHMWLVKTSGEIETAFAETRAELVKPEPLRTADVVMAEIRADIPKERPVEKLPKMPSSVRFDDVEQAKIEVTKTQVPERQSLPTGEYDIDGKIYVSTVRAAELRNTANIKSIQTMACLKKWHRTRNHAYNGILYLKSDVVEAPLRTRKI